MDGDDTLGGRHRPVPGPALGDEVDGTVDADPDEIALASRRGDGEKAFPVVVPGQGREVTFAGSEPGVLAPVQVGEEYAGPIPFLQGVGDPASVHHMVAGPSIGMTDQGRPGTVGVDDDDVAAAEVVLWVEGEEDSPIWRHLSPSHIPVVGPEGSGPRVVDVDNGQSRTAVTLHHDRQMLVIEPGPVEPGSRRRGGPPEAGTIWTQPSLL